MTGLELTAFITAVANAMACQLSDDEAGLVGAAFTQLGDTLTTISIQRSILEKSNDISNDKTDKPAKTKGA